MKLKKIALLAAAGTAVLAVASCGPNVPEGNYTYNTYTSVSPSDWNELTYQDNNDTQIMSYIGGSFFTYDYAFDSEGNIKPGEFEVEYSAATKLEDVTVEYATDDRYNVPDDATEQYAYRITLRKDLAWDDGTKITAEDFVYTMKEQLNPDFQNYRADSFYNGGTVIHNAQNYVKQGQSGWYAGDTPYTTYSADLDSKLVFNIGPSTEGASDYTAASCSFRASMGFPASYDANKTAAYLVAKYVSGVTVEQIVALQGKTFAEIKADAGMKATWDAIIGWWQTEPDEELDFFVTHYTYPEVSFEQVGFFAESKYELVFVLDKSLELLKKDEKGNDVLSYKAAYNLGSFPLVKKDLYESCKVRPSTDNALWTTTYNTSLETTASWGPYKLETFQPGKSYTLVTNPEWYGYNMKENKGLYQTTKIDCEVIAEYNTALQKFLAGGLDSIGIDVSVATKYKNSAQAIYTPDDYVGSLQLQSSKEALKSRESEGVNKTLLSYADFRKALSLSIDRAEYNDKCTTSSKAGFGLFNSMHYYDVENGGVYRNEDVAKQVLCDVYGVDVSKYASLDEAHDAITGFDLEQARALVNKAYDEAIANKDIKPTDKVVLTFGTSIINQSTQRSYDFLSGEFKELVKGTKLEGKFDTELKAYDTEWADAFRGGAYDVCTGGWTGAAWDPGYFLLAYLDPNYMYSTAWDTSTHPLEFKMEGVMTEAETMSLLDWYDCLNGAEGAKYNWAIGQLEEAKRLTLIAALEKEILTQYYTVPIQNSFGASMISYQIEYISRDYNTFMSYGGVKYMKYLYDDAQWAEQVAAVGGEIDYTVSAE